MRALDPTKGMPSLSKTPWGTSMSFSGLDQLVGGICYAYGHGLGQAC
jgi:hypothetical protein